MLSLVSMLNKTAGSLSDQDLSSAAQAIGGQQAEGLAQLFKVLRDAEPGVKVSELLSTPSANAVLQSAVQKLNGAAGQKEGGEFCRCPNCQFPFIIP